MINESEKGGRSSSGDNHTLEADNPSPAMNSDPEPNFQGVEKIVGDFQCFVCGAVFTTDEDRKQHLEKEAHGQLHEDLSKKEREVAKKQEDLNESREHII